MHPGFASLFLKGCGSAGEDSHPFRINPCTPPTASELNEPPESHSVYNQPSVGSPSWLHTTRASAASQASPLHTVPQAPPLQTSTRPWWAVPPCNLTAPSRGQEGSAVQLTPAAWEWSQSLEPKEFKGQSMSLDSTPVQFISCSQIWAVPLGNPVDTAEAAKECTRKNKTKTSKFSSITATILGKSVLFKEVVVYMLASIASPHQAIYIYRYRDFEHEKSRHAEICGSHVQV